MNERDGLDWVIVSANHGRFSGRIEVERRSTFVTRMRQRWIERRLAQTRPPRGSTFSDWRMALRRKLNGDTR